MPELPEVETIRRDLQKKILQKTFSKVEVHDPFILRSPLKSFNKDLEFKSIQAVYRRGKALLLQLSNQEHLLVHLMMTGQLVVNGKPDQHTRITFNFKDKSTLLYNDVRRFGQLSIVKDLSTVNYLKILGPEPLSEDFNAEYIFQKSRSIKRPIKNVLLDHTFVAGIGNIYACEILFRCGIDPQRIACKISQSQAKEIYKRTVEILELAIKHRGSSMRNYRDAAGEKGQFNKLIEVYAREGEACVVCKKPIVRIVLAGRSTFYCKHCQK